MVFLLAAHSVVLFLAVGLAGNRSAKSRPAGREWIVFSDSVVVSAGFVEATGCQVYKGIRYIAEIDHFHLFAENHYDINQMNELGFLTAHLRKIDEAPRFEQQQQGLLRWDVLPSDPIMKELGIRYAAFDQPVAPPAVRICACSPQAKSMGFGGTNCTSHSAEQSASSKMPEQSSRIESGP